MKKWAFSLAVLSALSACGESLEPGIVARVDTWTLTEIQLADLLVLAQPFPLDSTSVADLARHWVGAAAFAQRAAAGDDLAQDDAVRASNWLDYREALLKADREDRLRRIEVDPPQTAFEAGEYRLIAHVLRRVGPETTLAERALQQSVADRLLAALIAGGSWDDAVAESEDVETKTSAGLLGVVVAGELPLELDRVAFRLEPGQVSSVIESGSGFHVLYRPGFPDVAELFGSRLRDRLLIDADAASSEGVLARRNSVVSRRAAASFRRLAGDPLRWLDSDEVLLSWDGGVLTEGAVSRYLTSLPAPARSDLGASDESTLESFLEDLAVRELRVLDAQGRGLRPDDALIAQLDRQHDEQGRLGPIHGRHRSPPIRGADARPPLRGLATRRRRLACDGAGRRRDYCCRARDARECGPRITEGTDE